ncbi:MAG: hypothetical protein ACIALR_07660 [Blastopirellula sp. JB062]
MQFRLRTLEWKRYPRQLAALCLLQLLAVAGCSQNSGATASVSGQVTLDGTVVPSGSVVLIDQSGKIATAELQTDGTYSLTCSPGKYQVAVTPPPPVDPLAPKTEQIARQAVPVPKRYADVGTSGLTLDAKAGDNTHDLALDSSAKRN